MIKGLSFLHQDWFWPVLICAVALWALFLWKEYAHSGRKRFVLNAIISLIAVVALAAMVLQPAIPEDRIKGSGVILTKNYKKHQLDSLKSVHRGISEIAYSDDGFKERALDSINSAYVLGDGVASYDFWELENIATTYLGGNDYDGVVKLRYEQQLTVGDSISVSGMYAQPIIGNRIVMEDPSGNGLDSITVESTENLAFNLRSKTKVEGQFVYRLVEKDSLNVIKASNPLPVVVEPNSNLRILIINTFPTFETKYLKNFLAESGHSVLVRIQLTKDRYKFENFNRERGSIYGFTAANLADFDLVIVDIGSYLGLSRSSQQALEKRMTDEGLGVFIQPDLALLNNARRFGLSLKRKNIKETRLPQWPKVQIPVLPATFEAETLVQPIITSKDGVWSAYTQKGAGRLSTSMIADTYQLLLDGNEVVYQYIWSATLSAVGQKKLPLVLWETDNYIAYPDEPFHFSLRTAIPNPEVSSGLDTQIALRQDVQLRDQWKGVVYPKETGWNRVALKSDSTATMSYYVGTPTDWVDLKSYATRKENARVFNGENVVQTVDTTLKPISLVWFYVVFVLAMGYLWVVPRIDV